MFRLINAETVPLTRELAERHAAMTPSPTERPIDPSRIKWLQEAAEVGMLITFNWTVAVLDGEPVRINGQHSSKMLVGLNGEFPTDLAVHLDTYAVDDKRDLATLFRNMDSRKSARSLLDVSGAYQGLFDDLDGVERASGKLAAEGVTWYRRYVAKEKVATGDAVFTIFEETDLHPFMQFVGSIITVKTPELRTPAVAGAMFATYQANEDAARDFWERVSRGGDGELADPATVLDLWLTHAKSDTRALKVKPAQLYQGCVQAWNAERNDRPLNEIRPNVTAKGFLSPAA